MSPSLTWSSQFATNVSASWEMCTSPFTCVFSGASTSRHTPNCQGCMIHITCSCQHHTDLQQCIPVEWPIQPRFIRPLWLCVPGLLSYRTEKYSDDRRRLDTPFVDIFPQVNFEKGNLSCNRTLLTRSGSALCEGCFEPGGQVTSDSHQWPTVNRLLKRARQGPRAAARDAKVPWVSEFPLLPKCNPGNITSRFICAHAYIFTFNHRWANPARVIELKETSAPASRVNPPIELAVFTITCRECFKRIYRRNTGGDTPYAILIHVLSFYQLHHDLTGSSYLSANVDEGAVRDDVVDDAFVLLSDNDILQRDGRDLLVIVLKKRRRSRWSKEIRKGER